MQIRARFFRQARRPGRFVRLDPPLWRRTFLAGGSRALRLQGGDRLGRSVADNLPDDVLEQAVGRRRGVVVRGSGCVRRGRLIAQRRRGCGIPVVASRRGRGGGRVRTARRRPGSSAVASVASVRRRRRVQECAPALGSPRVSCPPAPARRETTGRQSIRGAPCRARSVRPSAIRLRPARPARVPGRSKFRDRRRRPPSLAPGSRDRASTGRRSTERRRPLRSRRCRLPRRRLATPGLRPAMRWRVRAPTRMIR